MKMLIKKIFIFLLILLVLALIDMTVIEPNLLVLKQENLFLPFWNKKFDGYKIGIVSDLHVGTHFVDLKKLRKVVDKINSQSPDLIVLLGDLDARAVYYSGYDPKEIAAILSDFKARNGVYAILGNHDYEPDKIIKEIYSLANISVLENEEVYINKNLRVYGFKDLWHYLSNPSQNIKKINGVSTLVLSHNPDLFSIMPEFADITLSGHTHGGEVYIPFLGAPFIPSEFGQLYRKGHVVENGRHLYISGGVASLSRLRFFNPPEISILKLYSSK
ncbi:metallophosphoesterase [bacterium]|nr:metallophosphoesterase [bacterium]